MLFVSMCFSDVDQLDCVLKITLVVVSCDFEINNVYERNCNCIDFDRE